MLQCLSTSSFTGTAKPEDMALLLIILELQDTNSSDGEEGKNRQAKDQDDSKHGLLIV